MNLTDPMSILTGVGKQRYKTFCENGLSSIQDLLYYFPRRYLDRTNTTPIKNLQRGIQATVIASVKTLSERPIRRGKIFQVIVSDGSGLLTLSWFNSMRYLKKKLVKGSTLAIHGRIDWYNGFTMSHPDIDFLESQDAPIQSGEIIPIYHLNQDLRSSRIEQRFLRKMIKEIFSSSLKLEDYLTQSFIKRNNLVDLKTALKNIHFSKNQNDLKAAIERLKFDEHYFFQLLMTFKKKTYLNNKSYRFNDIGPYFRSIVENLNFDLTNAQKKVVEEIHMDLKKKFQMNRLVQGDVGCGKTIVAILVSAIAVGNNSQVAIIAPTEILARQHYLSFKSELEKNKIPSALLIGKINKKDRGLILKGLSNGKIPIIVGTHALIQKDVKFKRLGLVIIDEQHRFGVNQRLALIRKGKNPHVLSMTATPIPRTLSITYHGDMDLSIIDELPQNRIPVKTKIVNPDRMTKIYEFIRKECLDGKQCIIVFPLIEESEKLDLEDAINAYEKLKNNVFKDLKVGLVHGKINADKKEKILKQFIENKVKILVSTTVIEVGIDVPNATVMLIENAERFGLTQLHQLRGRVGRGLHQSYCILVKRNVKDTSLTRLKALEETNDGFKLADKDLELRGPGEFFGLRQSGFLNFKIADLVKDKAIIQIARKTAIKTVLNDPSLKQSFNRGLRRHLFDTYPKELSDFNI